jgi:hypothetical protein
VHAECTVPPIKNGDAIKLLNCGNNYFLVSFIATMDNNIAAKNWASDIKTVKRANVPTGFTNSGTEPAQGAWDIVKLTVKCDGKCGVGKN